MGKLYRENEFKVVGTLVSADNKIGARKSDGLGYIVTTAVVKVEVAGQKNRDFEITFKSNEKTTAGQPNKLYETYSKLPNLQGKKVEISGEIKESRFWSNNTGQIISVQKLEGKWVKGALPTEPDEASFIVGGFIARELQEKKNKDNEIYRYDLMIGQETYADSGVLQMLTLHVNPTAAEVVRGVKNYQAGQTVKLKGSLDWYTEVITREEDSAFGKITKTYPNTYKNFYIEAGSNPLKESDGAFDSATISSLIEAYKAKDATLMQSAASTAPEQPVVNEAPVTKRQTSLI